MFNVHVSTALTTPSANNYYGRIHTGVRLPPDQSLIATLRALVFPRMTETDELTVYYGTPVLREIDLKEYWSHSAPDSIYTPCSNMLSIYNLSSGLSSDNTAWLDAIEEQFPGHFENYRRVEKVTVFFKKQFRVLCYISPENRSAVIFANNMSVRQYHYLQCAIPAFLPWYFSKEQGISDDERELIDSLREQTPDHYLRCIEKIASKVDMRTEFIKSSLDKFEVAFERREAEKLRDDIEILNNKLRDYQSYIAATLQDLRRKNAYLAGIENAVERVESGLTDYFLANKKLDLISVDEERLKFIVKDRLTYFDEDAVLTLIENKNSYLYRQSAENLSSYISPDDMELLFRAVFVDKTLYVRICAAIDITLNGTVHAFGYRYGGFDYSAVPDATPNPHLYWHDCFGDYLPRILERLRDRDYIMAFEQCVASNKSINVLESASMAPFVRTLYTGNLNNRCIELPDGSVVTPKEAIDYLKKEEQKDGEADTLN